MSEGGREQVFTYGAPALKFGPGRRDEIGFDLTTYAARRVLVLTDAGVAAAGHADRVAERIAEPGDRGRGVRPGARSSPRTSLEDAAVASGHAESDGTRGTRCGGRRRLDHRHREGGQPAHHQPGRALDYVNAPVGKARAPEHAL